MDYSACNVVYVDSSAKDDQLVNREDSLLNRPIENHVTNAEAPAPSLPTHFENNLRTLLETFSEVHVCTSGKSCIAKVSELNQSSIVELVPTLVLIDIPYDEQLLERPIREIRTPSPNSKHVDGILEDTIAEDAYGLKLLQWLATEIQYQSLSRLIVLVAICSPQQTKRFSVTSRARSNSGTDGSLDQGISPLTQRRTGFTNPLDQARTIKYLDMGAVDVLSSPLLQERLPSLAVHAYRAHKDASKEQRALLEMKRGRKRSWVGVDDQKPYAYLREAMVSGLMDGICKLGGDDEPFKHVRITVEPNRREKISAAVASWNFSAHEFTDDELLHAALLMLQHALSMPELDQWRISTENLTAFLVASRSAYNAFVPYHNFRHVVDVLQAIFHFLVQLGRLPAFPQGTPSQIVSTPIAALVRPFDALTLLITAIGHDVGHPGVNNAFLVTLNAPLAQLYNDRSVLESFHCAAYSQILRRHWPAAFSAVEMRQLMINSILATDMGLHFDYMKRMGNLEEKFHENGNVVDGWNGRLMEEHRTLACSLLIKCADISNVARKHEVAAQWTMILTDEFARQAAMEKDLAIPTALFAAPVREIIALGKSQIGFMNMFAIPLFQGVTNVMPAMQFCVDELHRNIQAWEGKIAAEQERKRQNSDDSMMDGMFSPRTMSVANPFDPPQKLGSSSTLSPDTDLRKALLTKSPFAPRQNTLDTSSAQSHYTSLPELTTSPIAAETFESRNPSPNESVADPASRRSSKPSQLQLSYNTGSVPGVVDSSSTSPEAHPLPNGTADGQEIEVEPSLVTDPVLVHATTPTPPQKPTTSASDIQRSSDTTESTNSAGDWASQATSATTGKMPLSPSTKGTSLASRESDERPTPKGQSVVSSPNHSQASHSDLQSDGTSDGRIDTFGKTRTLKKKTSRFRMNSLNFWKRNKSSSPPVPSVGARHHSADEIR